MNINYDDCTKISLVTEIEDFKEGYYSFKDTIFYGEKGGMPSDEGFINDLKVIDLKWDNDVLYHKVDGVLNNPINMEVDYRTRIINTSVQSMLHMLDGYYGKLGIIIVAIGVNPDNQWYEINTKNIAENHLAEIQEFVDRAVFDDIECEKIYIDGKDYPNEKYHKFKELRLIKFGDIDTQPCGTLHVNKTSQIGNVVFLRHEKTSRGIRIYFDCNLVINDHYYHDYHLLNKIAKSFNVKKEEIMDKIEKLQNDNKDLLKQLEDFKLELFKAKAKVFDDGNMIEVALVDSKTPKDLTTYAQIIAETYQKDIILVASINDISYLTIVTPSLNARKIYQRLTEIFEIRGGGSPKIVSANTKVEAKNLVIALNNIIEDFK